MLACTTFVLLHVAVTASPGAATDEIVEGIVRAGYRKVGVIPMVISRRDDTESTVSSLGPRARTMAVDVYDRLIAAAESGPYRGKFQVIPERVMRAALKSRSVEDLSKPRVLQELAEEVGGAEGFAILTGNEPENLGVTTLAPGGAPSDSASTSSASGSTKVLSNKGSLELLNPSQATVSAKSNFSDELTLSKAAYQGQSWELRRWRGQRLENVGIDLEGNLAFGSGSQWEREQYVKLKHDRQHPYRDSSFPYPVRIRVAGQEREPRFLDGKLVAELNPGEEYSVLLRNETNKAVYIALYVDGVNSTRQLLVEPDKLKTVDHWYLPPNSGNREIKGWTEVDRRQTGATQTFKRFRIVDANQSVAARQGFDENIGMITAICYTVGLQGIEQPSHGPSRDYGAIVGTGEGQQGTAALDLYRGGQPRGLMLAAWTIYYRTRQQLEEIQAGKSEDLVLSGGVSGETLSGKNSSGKNSSGKTAAGKDSDQSFELKLD